VRADETLQAISGWLCDGVPLRSSEAPPLPMRRPEGVTDGVRETLLGLGTDGRLHGVLSEPVAGATGDRRWQTAIVLLNVGGNYRIGPHRFYVQAARTLAAAGHRVLRLDLAGIGDSPPAPGQPWANLYDKDSAQDVRVALDALAQRGCREIVLMGVCSGSFVAFQSAVVDARVGGLVLMNSRLLEWTPGKPGDTWQSSMLQYAKSTDWYRRELLRPQAWLRIVRGEVNVRLIARRFLDVAAARLKRLWTPDAPESLTRQMKKLCRRGCNVLMLVSDADDGRDYVEFHFGAEGRRLKGHPNFRMAYVPDADHTFSRPGNQPRVLEELLRHLEQRLASPPAPSPAAAPLLPADPMVLRRPL
jgi:pimeloyl-ACP methyl ester carboxylesterase